MTEFADLSKPIMPKATAMWLIDNTTLTFQQIAEFCALHDIEVQALADAEVGRGIVERNPIDNNELTLEEIKRCEAEPAARLQILRKDLPAPKVRAKGPRYTPVSRRSDKPDAIAWVLKNHPELGDAAICRLVGTTKNTIESVRNRSHPNMQNLRPRHPAEIGLCTYAEFEKDSHKALRAMGRDPQAEALARQAEVEKDAAEEKREEESRGGKGGFDFANFASFFKTPNSGEQKSG